MKLGKLLEELSFNELSNLSLANDGNGTIKAEKLGQVVSAINSSLLDLHTRFLLNEKELIIRSLDWKAVYPLKVENAMSTSGTATKYILDTPLKPFKGDVIHVIAVSNEVGEDLPLNDPEHHASVFFPQPDTVQLTHPGLSQAFFVRYKASHSLLLKDGPFPLDQEITVPLALANALRYKTAAYIFGAMSGQEYPVRVQSLEAAYEVACQGVEANALLGPRELSTNVKLMRRGFP